MIPQVGDEFEVWPGGCQSVAKLMMTRNMLHALSPAALFCRTVKLCGTEAAFVPDWGRFFFEVSQAVRDPVFCVRECHDAIKLLKRAFKLSWLRNIRENQIAARICFEDPLAI